LTRELAALQTLPSQNGKRPVVSPPESYCVRGAVEMLPYYNAFAWTGQNAVGTHRQTAKRQDRRKLLGPASN
jgi:hypothetical protein